MAKSEPLSAQVLKLKTDTARRYSIVHSDTNTRYPSDPSKDLQLQPFMTPRGLLDGIYHVEFYDAQGEVIPLDPAIDAKVVVSRGENKPASDSAAADLPERPAKRVNRTVLYRQHVELRELVMEDINHMVKVREVIRRELFETQRAFLDQHKEVMDERHRVLEREKELIEQQRTMNAGAAEGKPLADYTQLGLGLLDAIKTIGNNLTTPRPSEANDKRLNEVLGEVVKLADATERQKMVADPDGWTKRISSLAGSLAASTTPPKTPSTSLAVSKDAEKPAAKTVAVTAEQTAPTPEKSPAKPEETGATS